MKHLDRFFKRLFGSGIFVFLLCHLSNVYEKIKLLTKRSTAKYVTVFLFLLGIVFYLEQEVKVVFLAIILILLEFMTEKLIKTWTPRQRSMPKQRENKVDQNLARIFWDGMVKRPFMFTGALMELGLFFVYLHYRRAYLIPVWYWLIISILLLLILIGIYVLKYEWSKWSLLSRGIYCATYVFFTIAFSVLISALLMVLFKVSPTFSRERNISILFAQFGESNHASQISQDTFSHLCNRMEADFAAVSCEVSSPIGFALNRIIEIIPSGQALGASSRTNEQINILQIGMLSDAAEAEDYIKTSKANMIIWGYLQPNTSCVSVKFELLEEPNVIAPVSPNFILPIKQIFNLEGKKQTLCSQEAINEFVAQLAVTYSGFSLGLAAFSNERNFLKAKYQIEQVQDLIDNSSHIGYLSQKDESLLLFYKARIYTALRSSKSLEVLKQANELNSLEPAILLSLSRIYSDLGQKKEEEKYLRLTLNLITQLPNYQNNFFAQYNSAIAFSLLAELERKEGNEALYYFEKANSSYARAFVLDTGRFKHLILLGWGKLNMEFGNWQDAKNYLEQASQWAKINGVNYSWTQLYLGKVYSNMGRTDDADKAYISALDNVFEFDKVWMRGEYATFLEGQGLNDKAQEQYSKMINEALNDWDREYAYEAFAAFNTRNKKWDDAEYYYRQAIKLNPNAALLHTYLGEILLRLNKLDKAWDEFEKGIELDPKNVFTNSRYATALLEHGTTKQAIALYQKALALDQSYSRAWLNLGIASKKTGEIQKAQECFCKVLNLNNDPEAVRAAKSALQASGAGCP